jgi:uroporphyrinogen decarboxylase
VIKTDIKERGGMTNKERLFRAFNHEPVDRIPVGFWFHFLSGDDLFKGLDNPALIEKNYAGHKQFIETFHPDFVKIMSDGFFAYPDPALRNPRGMGDLQKAGALDKNHPWIQSQVELVKRVTALQGDTAYFYNIFSPSSLLKISLGAETYFSLYREDPRAFGEALETIGQGIAVQAEQVIRSGGADGVYFSVQNPDLTVVSDGDYKKYIGPSDQAVLKTAAAAGGTNILHICGYEGARNHLEAWTDYEAAAYNWAVAVEGISLREGKKTFGGKAVIGGFANSADSLLCTGSREAVEAFTEKLVAEGGKTGVVIGADCTIPGDIPLERLDWVRSKAAVF